MLTSFNFRNSIRERWLVVLLLVGVFLFGGVSVVSAKVINLGTSADNIFVDGQMGVGLTNPGAKLDITNNGGIIGRFIQTGGWTGSEWALYVTGYSNLGGYRLNAADGIRGIYKIASGGTLGFATAGNDPITFTQSDSLERIRIAAGGNIGIGLTNPSAKLQITSGATPGFINSGSTRLSLLAGSGNATVMVDNNGDLYATSTTVSNAWLANGNHIYSSNSGNVGIGTSAPGAKLTMSNNEWLGSINAAGSATANMFKLNTSNQIEVGSPLLIGPLELAQDGGYLTFIDMPVTAAATNGTVEGYSLKLDGNSLLNLYSTSNGSGGVNNLRVGIGVTNPGYLLDIQGGQVNASGGLCIAGDCKTAWSQVISTVGDYWGLSGSNLYASSTSWNVGIGTTAPGTKLDITGTFRNTLGVTHSSLGGSGNVTVMADNTGTLYTSVAATLPGGTSGQTLRHNGSTWVGSANLYNNDTNIGIGTTGPGEKLQVAGNLRVGNSSASNYLAFYGITGDGPGSFDHTYIGERLYGGGELSELFLFKGNDVSGSGPDRVRIGAGEFRVDTFTSAISGSFESVASSGLLVNRFIVDNAGNVGIGTTAPDNLLTVSKDQNAITRIQIENPNSGASAGTNLLFTKNGVSQAGNYFNNSDLSYKIANYVAGDMFFSTTNVERMRILANGNVGIGKTNPAKKLDVVGDINASLTVNATSLCIASDCKTSWGAFVPMSGNVTLTGPLTIPGVSLTSHLTLGSNNISGVNKLTVSVIDPLYNINGVKYSTYAPSISGGLKEEYVGKAVLDVKNKNTNEFEAVIDFSQVKEGSDLWVWRKVIEFNKESVEVSVTPYGKLAQVYYLIDNNKLIFRSDKPVEVSYRLIARRFDWRDWPTLSNDQSEETNLIIKD